jgi:hypothetical protein
LFYYHSLFVVELVKFSEHPVCKGAGLWRLPCFLEGFSFYFESRIESLKVFTWYTAILKPLVELYHLSDELLWIFKQFDHLEVPGDLNVLGGMLTNS